MSKREKLRIKRRRMWLRKFKDGIRVYRPGRNDGLYVFRHVGEYQGRPYDKIRIAHFYDIDPEWVGEGEININWQSKSMWYLDSDGKKVQKEYFCMSGIEISEAETLAKAVLTVAGKDPEAVVDGWGEEKEPDGDSEILDDIFGG